MTETRPPSADDVVSWVANAVHRRRKRDAIVRQLVDWGATPAHAEDLVAKVQSEVARERRRAGGQQLLGCVFFIMILILANVALYVGQNLWKQDDMARAEQWNARLDAMQREIASLQAVAGAPDAAASAKGSGTGATPASARDPRLDSLVAVYRTEVAGYNELAGEAYDRFYLFPGAGSGYNRHLRSPDPASQRSP